MNISGFVFAVVVILCFSFLSANENLHIEATREGDEDIVTVTDLDGNIVSTTAVHPDGEYQLQKPNDENVCLVSRISEEGNEPDQCYERVPFPKDLEHNLELKECEDREVLLLEPVEPKDCDDAALISRRGRGVCIWIKQVQCYCAQYERVCTKKGWWWGKCKHWENRCKRYATRIVKTKKCY